VVVFQLFAFPFSGFFFFFFDEKTMEYFHSVGMYEDKTEGQNCKEGTNRLGE